MLTRTVAHRRDSRGEHHVTVTFAFSQPLLWELQGSKVDLLPLLAGWLPEQLERARAAMDAAEAEVNAWRASSIDPVPLDLDCALSDARRAFLELHDLRVALARAGVTV